MEKLYELLLNKYTLMFMNGKLEHKFEKNLNKVHSQLFIQITGMFLFLELLLLLAYHIYLVVECSKGVCNYEAGAEKIALVVNGSSMLVEMLLFLTGYFPKIKGMFCIVSNFIIIAEFAGHSQNCELPFQSLLLLFVSFFFSITYNQKFLPSTISFFLGDLYLFIKMILNPHKNVIHTIILYFVCIGLCISVSLSLYFYDTILRRNFILQQNIKKKKKFYQLLLESLPTSIIVLKNGKINYFNLCLKTLLGITANEYKEISELNKEEKNSRLQAYLKEIILDNDKTN